MIKKKILVTGGHFTSALSIVEALDRNMFDVIWIGQKYTMLFDKNTSLEFNDITSRGIKFINLHAGKLYRYMSWKAVISLVLIPIGLIESFFILLKEKPSLVLTFGGYIGATTAISAKILGIKIYTHEQTLNIGLANKLIFYLADIIFLGWKETESEVPVSKRDNIIITGNPIRKEILEEKNNLVEFNNDKKTILISCGNQGAHRINEIIFNQLEQLTHEYNIIHLTGSNTIFNDYEYANKLIENNKFENYRVFKNLLSSDYSKALHQSDMLIGRSGANTVYELGALKKPSILIPLPFAQNNEQLKNAEILKSYGLAEIIEEKNMTDIILLNSIKKVLHKDVMIETSNSFKTNASEIVAEYISKNI